MKIFITGILGLVGSQSALSFAKDGHEVYGVDNDMRGRLFGKDGSTSAMKKKLEEAGVVVTRSDITNPTELAENIGEPDVVIHCAAQPSHDYSIDHEFIDFTTNAYGTLSLLSHCSFLPNKPIFIYTSTIKVYGDVVNQFTYEETPARYVLEDEFEEFNEDLSIDGDGHSPFGVSKLCADLYCQEFAKMHDMNVGVFRLGCITGSAHKGVELHGFLSYLVKCGVEGKPYTIYGNGKQVRDQLHVQDLVDAFKQFTDNPKSGVYNLGGGIENSISINEAIETLAERGIKVDCWTKTNRYADHKYWVSDNNKFRRTYPEWKVNHSLDDIFDDLILTDKK